MIGNIDPTDAILSVAGVGFLLKIILPYLKGNQKVYTDKDIEDLTHRADMKSTLSAALKILENLEKKGDDRAHILMETHSTLERTHRQTGEILNNTKTLASLYGNTKFCKEQ
jgi:hypothetical protein